MEISEEKLQQIQNEIINSMDKEVKEEEEIIEMSKIVASKLLSNKKTTFEFNNITYEIAYRILAKNNKKFIYTMIANVTKQKIMGGKYIPFSATGEVDQNYSMYDNLKTVIETFIRHVTGKIKPEELN